MPLLSCSGSSASSSSRHILRRHRTTCVIINNINLFISLVVFLILFAAVNPAAAETSSTLSSPPTKTTTLLLTTTATIAAGTDGYKYIGCYNETTAGLSGTGGSGTRALYGGINEVLPGVMTVEKCLGFCKGGMEKKGYRFAGLEYSR
ncbi:uncharacterized protein B0T23DRAFT_385030 [Neurospora hispaniola]|uniref:WSC domain-containing protein n=1 Tax=Neurospora hispaniola TaxID=588809 RepID=A0AAJ0I3V3_9PEZI|nr:hypothetical protein B0T23DRAFT_385030 [Neurospora hispaniola]